MSDLRPPDSPIAATERRLPYSKGLMARALGRRSVSRPSGRTPLRASSRPSSSARRGAIRSPERVYDVAARVVAAEEGDQAVRRLRRYQALQETDLPLILLVGGATGDRPDHYDEVAHRLGITRVTSTDFVRQTMRAFFSSDFMPTIHFSELRGRPGRPGRGRRRPDLAASEADAERPRGCAGGDRARADGEPFDGARGCTSSRVGCPRRSRARSSPSALIAISDHDEHARPSACATPTRRACARWTSTSRRSPTSANPGVPDRARGGGGCPRNRERRTRGRRGCGDPARPGHGSSRPQDRQATSTRPCDPCRCESFAAVTERAARERTWLGRGDLKGGEAAASGDARGARRADHRGQIVIGAEETTRSRSARRSAAAAAGDLAVDPLEGGTIVARGDYGAMAMIAVGDPTRSASCRKCTCARWLSARRPWADRPRQPDRRERPGDRGGLRADAERRHRDRPRPAAAPGPRSRTSARSAPASSSSGRRRDRVHHRRDPRNERPPRDRDRRRAPGGDRRGRAPLPRRRAPGAALADDSHGDHPGRRVRDRRRENGSSPRSDLAPAR